MAEAKKCTDGIPCGDTCISKLDKCRNNHPKEGAGKLIGSFFSLIKRVLGFGKGKEAPTVPEPEVKKAAKAATVPEFDINMELRDADLLGQGGFGKVYRAGDAVIKEGDIEPNEKAVMKLLTEKGYDHSPKLLGETETRLAMTKVPGDTAANQMDFLEEEDKKNFFNVIKDLHKNGVAHGDIHPGNIMYDFDTGKTNLIDFGLAETESSNPYQEKGGQTLENLRLSMIKDALNAQHHFGNEKNKKDKLAKFKTISGGETEFEDFKEVAWELEDLPGIQETVKDKKKFDEFIADLYQP